MEDLSPVTLIIRAFRGYRPTQTALGLKSPNQVQHWEKSGRIRDHYKPLIREAATRLGVKLPKKAVFDQAFVSSPRRAA